MNNIKTLIALLTCFVSIASAASQSDAIIADADTRYTAIAAGNWHTVALKADGSLWAWGSNSSGQLGDGTTTQSLAPKRIGTGYTDISAGKYYTVALKSDGSLWAWGSNYSGQSLVPQQIGTGYAAISAGTYHTVALKSDGSLWTWGLNASGQLGDGTMTNSRFPKQVGTGYAAVSAGAYHTIALKPDGSLWTWGSNRSGQLGDGTTADSLVPKQVGIGYAAISAGETSSIALKSAGSLWAWGTNAYSQLGGGATSSLEPKQIGTATYTAIAAGPGHTVALKSNGSLWAWGWNASGQLGYATTTDSLAPKQIGTDFYTEIAAGMYHTVALKSDGSLWTWGGNYYGQLGDGTITDSLVPKQITVPSDAPDTPAPGVPAGLIAIPTTDTTSVQLFWTPSTDNVSVYKIYRDGVLISSTSRNYVWLSSSSPASGYAVSACDASGNCSAQSATTSVTPSIQAPSAPTGLTATPISSTQINLIWASPFSNIGVAQYRIYRYFYDSSCVSPPNAGPTCEPLQINASPVAILSVNRPQTSYKITGLLPSTHYDYGIIACGTIDNCSAEAWASATTRAAPIPTLKVPPTATAASYGPLSNQTLRVTMDTPANVLTLKASIFMAAVLPPSRGGGTYLRTGNGAWIPYNTCSDAPAVQKTSRLSATQQLDAVSTPTDLSSLKSTTIYVGYGLGGTDAEACVDMLNNSTYTQAYTID